MAGNRVAPIPALLLLFWTTPMAGASESVPRTISIQAMPNPVTYGQPIVLSGSVEAPEGAPNCVSNVEVAIAFDEYDDLPETDPPSRTPFKVRGRTAGDGSYSFTQDLPRAGTFWAKVAEDPANGCEAAVSQSHFVEVRSLVVLKAKRETVREGGAARLRVRVWPSCGLPRKIFLEKRVKGDFVRIAGKQPPNDYDRCRVVFRQPISRRTVVRGMTPSRGGGFCCFYKRGWSEPLTIDVRGGR